MQDKNLTVIHILVTLMLILTIGVNTALADDTESDLELISTLVVEPVQEPVQAEVPVITEPELEGILARFCYTMYTIRDFIREQRGIVTEDVVEDNLCTSMIQVDE